MSLNAIVGFCAKRPFLVIGVWVVVLLSSFYLSATYIEDALSGGQGSTIDQESVLARKLKDEKLSLPNAVLDGKDASSELQMQESNEESGSDNLLIVSSSKYVFLYSDLFKFSCIEPLFKFIIMPSCKDWNDPYSDIIVV